MSKKCSRFVLAIKIGMIIPFISYEKLYFLFDMLLQVRNCNKWLLAALLIGAAGSALAGTPYLIQWSNTGEVMTHLHFFDITWDDDQTADDAGTGEVQLRGFYGKTHINDDMNGETHLNLFLQGNNTLYWPIDGADVNAKMLGFRAWFRINGTSVQGAPVHRVNQEMPAAYKEVRNGQLVIIRNGQTFSVNGQRL